MHSTTCDTSILHPNTKHSTHNWNNVFDFHTSGAKHSCRNAPVRLTAYVAVFLGCRGSVHARTRVLVRGSLIPLFAFPSRVPPKHVPTLLSGTTFLFTSIVLRVELLILHLAVATLQPTRRLDLQFGLPALAAWAQSCARRNRRHERKPLHCWVPRATCCQVSVRQCSRLHGSLHKTTTRSSRLPVCRKTAPSPFVGDEWDGRVEISMEIRWE